MTSSALRPLLPALLGLALLPGTAQATNGYFAHGYGARNQALAGAGIAFPEDALALVVNPAGITRLGARTDVGLTVFLPKYASRIEGSANPAANDAYAGSGKRAFFVPEFGLVRPLSEHLQFGLAVFGNGGLNSEYRRNPFQNYVPPGGPVLGTAGVNLEQLFVTPTVAWRLSERASVAVGLNVAYQRFEATGLGLFGSFSQSPQHLSDRGTDTDLGAGLRLGWQAELAPGWVLGATWSSKIRTRFEKYRGLFSDSGRLDVPENYGLGLAWTPRADWTVALDVQRILYSEVHAIGNSAASLFAGQPLGSADGPGFGWRDQTIVKLGVAHRVDEQLTLRAGASHARQPVPRGETFFNILAPAVVQTHLSFGASLKTGGGEWSAFYTQAFRHTVKGQGSIPPAFGGGEADVQLREHIVGLAYSWAW